MGMIGNTLNAAMSPINAIRAQSCLILFYRLSPEISKRSFKVVIHVIPATLPKFSKQFAEFLAKEGFETGLKDVLKAVAMQN